MEISLCQCGCGQQVKWSRSHGWAQFVKGHNQRGKPSSRKIDLSNTPLCQCGCGQQVAGRKRGQWHKYLYGHSPRIKKHHPDSIEKMRQAAQSRSEQVAEDNRKRVWTDESRRKLSEARKAMGERAADMVRGDKNAMWRDGHREKYQAEQKASGFNAYQRRKVREQLIRERGHKCQRCEKSDIKLELHHIDHDLFYNLNDNLMLVCRSCNMKYTAEFVKENKPL